MSERLTIKERPPIKPQTIVNLGKCASCPLAERCAVLQMKKPEIVEQDNCQAMVEAVDFGGVEKLTTKEQFENDKIDTVWATNLKKIKPPKKPPKPIEKKVKKTPTATRQSAPTAVKMQQSPPIKLPPERTPKPRQNRERADSSIGESVADILSSVVSLGRGAVRGAKR